ncbi:MAG: DNA mismatch repair protein MutS, partial [Clostridia bacterium]|nr:DNA mismatch repair protein MutS [Clostridia bacterium]
GVPGEVVSRAKKILKELESSAPRRELSVREIEENDNVSFADLAEQRLIERLKDIDINTITPIEAMSMLYELKKDAEK